eukprot:TRINITY_DN3444_c0_g1_i2.p2 TRINITY_DN3444_c0_g1~~TRINITY_DN3444_c0_g1_i2.p2  ORF type:complete len:365 (+),score=68.68 TRINITY_DN3444_c0_g1_i2:10-1104(+)
MAEGNREYTDYKLNVVNFRVSSKYQLIEPIGHGAYGLVCSATDQNNQIIAIKKINKAFENIKDTKRTLREIKLLKHFNHINVLSLIDIQLPEEKDKYDDVYIITELMDTDLHRIIESQQPLSMRHIQYFLYQILCGVQHMHSANVLHRDLKPSNLLVNSNCSLKICDFGMARVAASAINGVEENVSAPIPMTEYVATRWYRAPEVILSWKRYTKAIDMWSVGCIFFELLTLRPLFTGRDYMDQIHLIVETLGSPSDEDLMSIISESARTYIQALEYKQPVDIRTLVPENTPEEAIDLLYGMLAFNPAKRCTVEQGLSHPFLANLYKPENNNNMSVPTFNFDFERYDLSKENYRDLIYQEALAFQ